jgi:hypothetical protein
MLYTHYCPLFHLTNLIAIFSPLILALKIAVVSVVIIGKIFAAIGRFIAPVLIWLDCKTTAISTTAKIRKLERREKLEWERHKAQDAQRQQHQVMMQTMTTEEKKQRAIMEAQNKLPGFMNQNARYATDFDYFWNNCKGHFTFLGRKHAKKHWNNYAERIKAHQALIEARKQKRQAWMVFWVNFSRFFFKSIFSVIYVALFAVVAYCTFVYGIPFLIGTAKVIAWVAAALWAVEWAFVIGVTMWIIGYGIALVGTIGSIAWLAYKAGKNAGVPFNWMWEKTLPPRALVSDTFSAFGNYVTSAFKGVIEFVSLFYEENCPTITVVANGESED